MVPRTFVRYVSHEIRTPLNTMYSGLELLEMQLTSVSATVPKAVFDNIQAMKTSCRISVNILDDLLVFENLEKNVMTITSKEVPVKPLIEHTLAIFQPQANQEDVEFKIQYFDLDGPSSTAFDSFYINVDQSKFSQVLRNLASNALKFTPPHGKVTVNVRVLEDEFRQVQALRAKEASEAAVKVHNTIHDMLSCISVVVRCMMPRGRIAVMHQFSSPSLAPWQGLDRPMMKKLRIEFSDTGSGIAPENLHKLFREGVQVDATLNQGGGGSGMGLFISKRIMDLHNGVIGVTSEGVGLGCTFFIEIPIIDVCPVLSQRNPKASVHTHSVAAKYYHFLVVDDSSLTRKMMLQLLTALGHRCTQAVDGEDAIRKYEKALAEEDPIDVILME